jgi:hypothetical protein
MNCSVAAAEAIVVPSGAAWLVIAIPTVTGAAATGGRSAAADAAITTSTASVITLAAIALMKFATPNDMDSRAFSITKSSHTRFVRTLI